MRNLLLALCLASWGLAMVIGNHAAAQNTKAISEGSSKIQKTEATLLSFFTKAPEYIANALKHPQTTWSSSRILPVFWTQASNGTNGAEDAAASSSICQYSIGRWLCGLLAGTSLLAIAFAGLSLMVLVSICIWKKVTSQCDGEFESQCSCKRCQSRHMRTLQLPIAEPKDGYSKLKSPKLQ